MTNRQADGRSSSDGGRRHRVAIALGSNIGDRRGNLASALHKLRSFLVVDAISSVYETKPVGFTQQPDFLNMAIVGRTDLEPSALRESLAKVERQVGRWPSVPLGPRAIDLDLLLYDDVVLNDERCTIPHPGLQSRAFVLVPLAEIAPAMRDPVSGRTIAELAQAVDQSGVERCAGGLLTRLQRDVQESRPHVPLALNRAGITGVRKRISLGGSIAPQHVHARCDVFADLDAQHSGVHMSRFSQDLEDALTELTAASDTDIGRLALNLAAKVVESQHAEQAEVRIEARFALPRVTPASALPSEEFYALIGRSVARAGAHRRMVGVQAEGMTACPCAQSMVGDYARERLLAEGFGEEQVAKILAAVPLATHNQRSRGTLLIGSDRDLDVPMLVEIVEQSMSSETYDLLKRPDELFVVNKAHLAPRFVEDVVREMLRSTADALADFPDDAFVWAEQTNDESIHKHDAVAQSCATLGELRRELSGETGISHTSLEQWLYGMPQGVIVK